LAEFASGHPDDLFLGVSSGSQDLPENVLSIGFDLVPPAFIAGYTAATATETGEVGAVVSRGFPQAEKILTAFAAGVDLYNEERGAGADGGQSRLAAGGRATGEALGRRGAARTARRRACWGRATRAAGAGGPLCRR